MRTRVLALAGLKLGLGQRFDQLQCALRLPEVDQELRFEAEVLYRADVQGGLPGLGLRFSEISAEDEAALIDFLARLEGRGGRIA